MPRGLRGLPQHVAAPDPSRYLGDDYVIVDFETTTHLKGTPVSDENRIVLAVWKRGNSNSADRKTAVLGVLSNGTLDSTDTLRHRFGGEYDLSDLVGDIRQASFMVAHNAKFELGWLRRCGLDLRDVVVYCTQIGEYVRGGNRYPLQQLSLNKTAERYGLGQKQDIIGKMWAHGIETPDIPESWLLRYCIKDVELCEQIFLQQREILKLRNLLPVQYLRCLVTPMLADLERRGMQLDEDQVNELMETMEDEYAAKTAELQDFSGGVPAASVKQKREYIYGVLGFKAPLDYRGKPILTPSGDFSVSADALARLRPKTGKQRDYLRLHEEWANLHADVTKYLRKFRECCKETGGVLHAAFNQCSTRTHRLSSNGVTYKVQFQNLNRRFKPLFCSRNDGWYLGEADGAQLEFRVAAHLGRDRVALGDIWRGVDIHAFTADVIGCTRQEAKAHTFKPLYGGKSGTAEQKRYYSTFEEKYSGVSGTQRNWCYRVLRTKELETEWGLKYYWPTTKMTESGYITNTTSICNYPVQALATAEIIPAAMVCAWHRMRDMESFLVNTVHDSIIAEVHPDEVDLWHTIAKQCLITDAYMMMENLYDLHLTVPLGAGVMLGTHWGSKDEQKYEAPEELWLPAAKKEGMVDEDMDRQGNQEVSS
jgi:DNA polymerase I-like protein with 3'-5' exonuclease and polymerase domains